MKNARNNTHRTITTFFKNKKGDASLNWILGVVISVAIVAGLVALVNAAIPNLWTTVMSKITTVLG
jgi:Flp pilus assembly pilin Flp